MIDSQFSRLVLEAGIAWARQQCDALERQLSTHSPECDAKATPAPTKPEPVRKTPTGRGRLKDPEYQKALTGVEEGLKKVASFSELKERYHVGSGTIVKVREKLGNVKKVASKGWAKHNDPAYKELVRKVEEGLKAGEVAKELSSKYGIRESQISRIRQRLGLPKYGKRHKEAAPIPEVQEAKPVDERLQPKGIPIVVTRDPDINGFSGFCKCGSVIKLRPTMKADGMVDVPVCGSCHLPVEHCTCRKVVLPLITPSRPTRGAKP